MKRVLTLGLIYATALFSTACTKQRVEEMQGEPTKEEQVQDKAMPIEPEEEFKIGFTVQDLANPYFVSVAEGMKCVCSDMNIELTIHNGKSNVESQTDAIYQFVEQEMDAIIIAPVEETAPEKAVQAANDAGIPVISLAQYVEGSSGYIRLNEHEYGRAGGIIAGEWILENFSSEESAKVLLLKNTQLSDLVERARGIRDGIKERAPGAVIVSEREASTPEAAKNAVEKVLKTNPDINVVVCCNDSAALGAYDALVMAGKRPGENCVVGLDATEEALKKIEENTMYVGTVDVAPFEQGKLCLETALEVIKNGTMEEDIYLEFIPVTEKNIGDYIK